MASPYQRRLEKLETTPADRERFADVALRLMRYEIERRSLGWEHHTDGSEEAIRRWEAIQRHSAFAEMDAAVRRGERVICCSTVEGENR